MLLKNFVKSYLYCKLYKDLTKLFFNATWSPYIRIYHWKDTRGGGKLPHLAKKSTFITSRTFIISWVLLPFKVKLSSISD